MNTHSQKKVLVTGAEGALGSKVAQKFLSEGYEVYGTYHAHSGNLEKVQWIQVNLTDSKSVHSALQGQSFDVLVHCAGGFRFCFSESISDQDLDFLMNTNLKSAFYLVRELLPAMKKQNHGRIIFISSASTLHPVAGMSAYLASKGGLNMLTSSLAQEVKSFDITVNSILPSIIDTPANRKDMPTADFSSWVKPEQIADLIFSLTQTLGNPIHGACIPVSGRL